MIYIYINNDIYIYITNLIIMILLNNWIGNFGNLPNLQSPRPIPGLVGGAIEFSFPWRKSAENTVDSRGSVGPGEGLEMLPGTPAFLGQSWPRGQKAPATSCNKTKGLWLVYIWGLVHTDGTTRLRYEHSSAPYFGVFTAGHQGFEQYPSG